LKITRKRKSKTFLTKKIMVLSFTW